jgi:hypothetical protein
MGLNITKEWSEVTKNGSPGSPDSESRLRDDSHSDSTLEGNTTPFGKSVKDAKKKFKILSQDPRSATENVIRTPIRFEKIDQVEEKKTKQVVPSRNM